jgi:hypothetical protein
MELFSLSEERLNFRNEPDRYKEWLHHYMCGALADLLKERFDEFLEVYIHRQHDFINAKAPPELWDADLIYKMQIAVLTPQRYKELLEKEYRLEKLEK